MTDRYFAFISYASGDGTAAGDLVNALEAQGLACWVAPRNIDASTDYGEQILQGIRDSTNLVLVFSQHSNTSKFCQREVERAVHYGRRIFPVRIDNSVPSGAMEFHLSVVQWMDAQGDKDWTGVASQLVQASERLSSQAPAGFSMPSGRGSKPYRFEDRDFRTGEDLGAALAQNWAAGEKNFVRGLVSRWVEAEVGNHELALRLQDIEQDRRTDNQEKLSLGIAELSPAAAPFWRGEAVTAEWAAGHPEELQALLSSRARARLEQCPGWPADLIQRLEAGLAQLDEWTSGQAESYIRKTALHFLLCPDQDALDAAVAARRRDYPEGRSALASRLLDSAELDPLEAVLLVSLPTRALVSAEERARTLRRRRIAKVAIPVAAILLFAAAGYGFHLRCLSRTTASFVFTVDGQAAEPALGGVPPVLELDGRPLVYDASQVRVAPGPHRLEVKDSRFLPLQAEVMAKYGRGTDWGTLNLAYGRGTVEISSDPDGAQVFQNRTRLGQTPLKLPAVKSGEVSYELRDAGLGMSVVTGAVVHGRTLVFNHRFPQGTVEVFSDPPGVEVRLGAVLVGKTPLLLPRHRPGPVAVSLNSAQWGEKVINAEVADGTTNRLQHRFPRGAIHLTSNPAGVQVRQAGALIGMTPLKLDDLPPGEVAGEVEFALVANEFTQHQVKLTVRDADVVNSHHEFAGGSISVSSKPAGMPVWAATRQLGVTPLKTNILSGDTLIRVAPTNTGFLPQLVTGKTNGDVTLDFEARHGSVVAWGAGGPQSTNSPDREKNRWMHFGQAVPPAGLKGVLLVAAGYHHSLALKRDGTVAAWGENTEGQCAIPSGLSDVVAVSAGYLHSLALRRDGRVVAWGGNADQQSKVPANLVDVVAVAAGLAHSVALRRDGGVIAWGSNEDGQCNVPANLTNVIAIASGRSHSIALRGDGSIAVWGTRWVGNGVSEVGGAVAIAAGDDYNLVLLGNGRVLFLGRDLGFQRQSQPPLFGNTEDATNPVPIGLTNVVAIAAGPSHSLALTQNGAVVAWGAGFDTKNTLLFVLSDKETNSRKKKGLPADLFAEREDSSQNHFGQSIVPKTLRKPIAIAAGGAHSLVIVADDP